MLTLVDPSVNDSFEGKMQPHQEQFSYCISSLLIFVSILSNLGYPFGLMEYYAEGCDNVDSGDLLLFMSDLQVKLLPPYKRGECSVGQRRRILIPFLDQCQKRSSSKSEGWIYDPGTERLQQTFRQSINSCTTTSVHSLGGIDPNAQITCKIEIG